MSRVNRAVATSWVYQAVRPTKVGCKIKVQDRSRRRQYPFCGHVIEAHRVRQGVDREDTDRPDDKDRQPRPDDASRRVGEGGLREKEEKIEELLSAQPGLDRPFGADSGRGRDQDRGRDQSHVENDEAKLDRLTMWMMAQSVRDVAEDEEHEGIGPVVKIAWPGNDREQPHGDDDDGGEPRVERKLKTLELGLPDACPQAVPFLERPREPKGAPHLMAEADGPGRLVRHVRPRRSGGVGPELGGIPNWLGYDGLEMGCEQERAL
jgi:hypothetical protein